MKTIFKTLMATAALWSGAQLSAQKIQYKTETVHIAGNCEMCKARIEQAGTEKGVSELVWDEKTKTANLRYNPAATGLNAVLKRVALAGHDNNEYLAPATVYAALPACCRYERKSQVREETKTDKISIPSAEAVTDQKRPEQRIYSRYFELKDALVNGNAPLAARKAGDLAKDFSAWDGSTLTAEQNILWKKSAVAVQQKTEQIAASADITLQRQYFAELSPQMYSLMQAVKPGRTVYYQRCEMFNGGKGGHWLSLDSEIKNPFYGNAMLACGSTLETLK